jgi:allantoinase
VQPGRSLVDEFRVRLSELILCSTRVVLPTATQPAAIRVKDGKIAEILNYNAVANVVAVEDVGDLVVMPGLVDTHVHVNEPGRTEWEGFSTVTRAAAAGGVTTIVDMPLNSIPATTNVSSFQAKLQAAAGQCWVDTGFWGGLVDDNFDQLEPLARDGVLGFKSFLVPSGVPEFAHTSLAAIEPALATLRDLGLPLLIHAELPGPIAEATAALQSAAYDPCAYECYLRSRPPEAELEAISGLIELAALSDAHIHIVHLATAAAFPMLRAARARRVPITVETCPHYLYFAADEIAPGATEFKCAPPLRDASNREALLQGLLRGVIDMVVTDHSPCEPELKRQASGDFFQAWGGIASLQLRLPVVHAVTRDRGASFAQLSNWVSAAPALLAGLDRRKGRIAPGYDADFVVWDPDATRVVAPEQLLHRHKLTPYAGRTLPGIVHATYLRGTRIFDGATVTADATGTLLLRSEPV